MSAKVIGNPDVNYIMGIGYVVICIVETWKPERVEYIFHSFIEASRFASKLASNREIEL